MARILATQSGAVLAVQTDTDAQRFPAPYPNEVGLLALDFDETTNAALVADVRAAAPAYHLTSGVLTKDDAPVAIQPPAPAPSPPTLNEQLAGALAALPADQPITGGQLAEVIALLRGPQ